MTLYLKPIRIIVPIMLLLGSLFGYAVTANAYTAAEIDANVPNARTEIVYQETECENRLNAARANGGTPRSNVNESNGYPKPSWISARGNRAAQTINATWGSTANIPLQSNQLIFICAILVQPVQNADWFVDRSTIVTPGTFPNERVPDNANPINNAALQGVSTRINSARVVSGGGSITNVAGAVYDIPRTSSRYWFSVPVNFDYIPGGPLTSRTVIIEFNITMISTYNGGVRQCGPPTTTVLAGEFWRCPSTIYHASFTVNAPEPLVVSCGALNITNNVPEIGTDTNLSATMTYRGSGGATTFAPTGASMTVVDPNGVTTTVTGFAVNPPSSGSTPGTFTLTGTYRPTVQGRHTVRWVSGVNGTGPPTATCGGNSGSPTDTFLATLHPYFEVNAGDVLAGTAFSTSSATPCAASTAPHNPNAGIFGWNARISPGFGGAGVDYAVFALNYIQDAAASRANTAGSASALTFSNVGSGSPSSVTPASGLFGGMFGSLATCVDYWGSKPPDSELTPFSASNLSSTTTGRYVVNGNLTLNGGNINNGSRTTLYVNGDVYITGNIEYPAVGGWSRLDQIPNFNLVVLGRIFINEAVTQLDGVYVAIPSSVDYANPSKPRDSLTNPRAGTILTCAAGFIGYSADDIAANPALCDGNGTPLTINGSFIAAQMFLLRTRGTVTSNSPAEIFNYSPEVWLAPTGNSAVGADYDSIVELSPVL